jgi:hypothetical protein
MSGNEISFGDLAAGLRGWVRGGTRHEQAAVELLSWHETWLRRPDFREACITQLAPGLVARIDWYEAREFVDGATRGGANGPCPPLHRSGASWTWPRRSERTSSG